MKALVITLVILSFLAGCRAKRTIETSDFRSDRLSQTDTSVVNQKSSTTDRQKETRQQIVGHSDEIVKESIVEIVAPDGTLERKTERATSRTSRTTDAKQSTDRIAFATDSIGVVNVERRVIALDKTLVRSDQNDQPVLGKSSAGFWIITLLSIAFLFVRIKR